MQRLWCVRLRSTRTPRRAPSKPAPETNEPDRQSRWPPRKVCATAPVAGSRLPCHAGVLERWAISLKSSPEVISSSVTGCSSQKGDEIIFRPRSLFDKRIASSKYRAGYHSRDERFEKQPWIKRLSRIQPSTNHVQYGPDG